MVGFLLFLIGVILIVLNIRAIKKENTSFNMALSNKEKNMQDYEVEIGKLRKEFAETILELQKEIEELKALKNKENCDNDVNEITNIHGEILDTVDKKDMKSVNSNDDEIENSNISDVEIKRNEYNNINSESKKQENIKEIHNNVKVDEISKMLDSGLSIDEISEKVHMGKGEVLLIKELYIK